MRRSVEKQETVPFYKQPQRNRTPSAAAREYAAKGWTWNGKKYSCRDEWEAEVLGYKGPFTLPAEKT